MFAPSHPGSILKENLDALNLSVARAAEALGVDRSALHRVVSGKASVSAEMAVRLEIVIGSTADHWLRMQAAYDVAQVKASKHDLVRTLSRIVPA